MARNVGSIEVTVDADTGKLKAQITKAGHDAGQAGAKALSDELGDLDTSEALNRVRLLRKQIEAQLEAIDDLDLDVDASKVHAELNRIKLAEAQLDTTINLDAVMTLEEAKAQLRAFERSEEGRELEIALDPVFTEINRLIGAWRDSEEADDLGINITADVLAAKANLDALREAQGLDNIEVRLEALIAEAEEQIFQFRVGEEENDLPIEVTAKIAAAEQQIESWRLAQAQHKLELAVEVATAEMEAELEARRLAEEADALELKVILDMLEARAQLMAFRLAAQRNDIEMRLGTEVQETKVATDLAKVMAMAAAARAKIEIFAEIDTSSFARAKAFVMAFGKDAGDDGGREFSRGFASGISDGSELAVGAIAILGDNVYTALEGTVASIVALASSAVYAIGGLGAGALAGIAIAGFALGATVVGLEGVGTAMGTINDEFAEATRAQYGSELAADLGTLAPNAMLTMLAFAGIRQELANSREEIQQSLFAGLDSEVRALATETLPDVTEALQIAAEKVNTFARNLSEIAQDTDFTGLMEALGPAMDEFFRAGEDAVGVIEPFLLAAAPAALILAAGLHSATSDLKDWATSPAGFDDIQTFFSEGAASLLLWAGLLSSIGGLLATIFEEGAGPGDNFVQQLDDIIAKWDGWLESTEGQTALENFFAGGETLIQDLEPLFTGLKEMFDILAEEGNADALRNVFEALGTAGPALGEFLALMGDLEIATGFALVLEVITPILDLLNSLPDSALKVIGAFIGIGKAISIISKAMSMLKMSHPYLAALGAAIVGVGLAIDFFSGSNESAEARAREFTDALSGNIDALLGTEAAANPAAAATKAMADAMAEGEEGQKLTKVVGDLGLTLEDVTPLMAGLKREGEDAIPALADLGAKAGVTGHDLDILAVALASTDANGQQLWPTLRKTAIEMGMNATDAEAWADSMLPVAANMEEVQDQAEKLPLEEIALNELEIARGADAASKALLAESLEMEGLSADTDLAALSTEQLTAVYDNYIQGLIYASSEEGKAAAAAEANALAMSDVRMESMAAAEAAKLHAEAEGTRRLEMFRSRLEAENLARETEAAAQSIAESKFNVPEGLSQGFIDLGESIRDAREDAESFKTIMDDLFGAPAEWRTAFAAAEEGLDELRNMIDGVAGSEQDLAEGEEAKTIEGWSERVVDAAGNVVDATSELGVGFNLGSEAGRELDEMAIGLAGDITELGAAGLSGKKDLGEVTTEMGRMRGELVDTLDQLGLTRAGAEAYVNELIGTPEQMETLIATPGLVEALMGVEELTLSYDAAKNPVITEFEQMGIELTTEQVEILLGMLEEMGIEVVEPEVSPDGIAPAAAAAQDVIDKYGTMADLRMAAPQVSTAGIDPAAEAVRVTTDELMAIHGYTATPTVNVPTAEDAAAAIGGVKTDLGEVDETNAQPEVELMGHLVMIALLAVEQTMLNTLNDTIADPTLKLSDLPTVTGQILGLGLLIGALDRMVADPDVKLDHYETVKGQIATLGRAIAGLDLMVASPSVTLSNYSGVMAQIDNIEANLNAIQDETVNVTTVQSTIGAPAMSGAMIDHPQLRYVGERGYREAMIPLDLPLNRVSPEIRELAALIRGEPMPSLGPARPQRGANITQNFTLASADPKAVAVQALNRAAAMAT